MGLPWGLEAVFPAAFWGLLAIVPLTILQLYARRRRRKVVPFAPLLVETLGPARQAAWFRRLREGASLLLRALALAGLVFALAGVQAAGAASDGVHTILVLDGDGTLAARESAAGEYGIPAHAIVRTRADWADALAAAWIRSLPRERERLLGPLSVIRAGSTPEVRALAIRDPQVAEALAARGLHVAGEAGERADLGAAIALARDVARREDAPPRIVVISARAAPSEEADAHDLLWQGCGRADQNARIVGLGAEEREAGVWRVTVQVDREGARRNDVALALFSGSRQLGTSQIRLEGTEPGELVLELPAAVQGQAITVRLEGADDYERDDMAYLWLPPTTRTAVLLAHDGAPRPYTAAAIEALPDLDRERSAMVRAADLAQAEVRDVVIVDGAALGPGALRPGAWIFLAPLAGALPFEVAAPVKDPLVWRTDPHHPLLRGLDLTHAFAVRGYPLAGAGLEPLAFAEGAAVVAEGEREGVRYVVLGIDPEGSALPLRAAYPLLIRNAVRRLVAERRAPFPPVLRAGDPLVPRAGPTPPGARAWRISAGTPGLGEDVAEGDLERVPVGWAGFLSVREEDTWRTVGAVNDLNPERRIAPARPPALAPAPAVPLAPPAQRWRMTWLLLAAALLVLDLLWLGARRRREVAGRAATAAVPA